MGYGCTFFFFLEVLYRSPVAQAGIPRPTQPNPFAFISKVLKCQACTPMLTSLMCVCARVCLRQYFTVEPRLDFNFQS